MERPEPPIPDPIPDPSRETVILPRPDPLGTQAMPVIPPAEAPDVARSTAPLLVASTALQNLQPPPEAARTQAMALPPAEPSRVPPAPAPAFPAAEPAPSRSPLPWILGGGAGLLCLGAAWLLWLRPEAVGSPRAVPPLEAPGESVPEVLKPYLERAKTGDTKAMRMLGARYTYGLDVPRNAALGRRWYQKAADAGDATAKTELAQLGP